jgi:hypothetical protein
VDDNQPEHVPRRQGVEVTARKLHTIATLAQELDDLLPGLTTAAAPTLARTLLRGVGAKTGDGPGAASWSVVPLVAVVETDDRNRVLAKARRLYL